MTNDELAQLVTVAIVPRERFSVARKSLGSVLSHTDPSVPLVYLDGRGPRDLQLWLQAEAARRPFKLVRSEHYVSPSQARNLVLDHITTRYVVFIDNDVLVTPRWLESLVACAEETGAAAVGPLMFEGDPTAMVVHNAGGNFEFVGPPGQRDLVQHNEYGHRLRSEIPPEVGRRRVDYVEFHGMLVRAAVFDQIGRLDEGLLSTREHLDLCLRLKEVGGEVWSEMDSAITYENPPPVTRSDLPFFMLRWSEAWNRASLEHFARKYGLGEQYLVRKWGSGQRRQAVFRPFTDSLKRVAGTGVERVMVKGLGFVERMINEVAAPMIARRHGRRAASTP